MRPHAGSGNLALGFGLSQDETRRATCDDFLESRSIFGGFSRILLVNGFRIAPPCDGAIHEARGGVWVIATRVVDGMVEPTEIGEQARANAESTKERGWDDRA